MREKQGHLPRVTRSCVSCGRRRKSFTTAVSNCSCTVAGSSTKMSRNCSNSSSAFSMWSEYSPMIQIMAALACDSSSESRFSHSVAMMPSYRLG